MKFLSRISAIALLAACAWTTAGAHAASLIGDSVDVTLSGGIVLEDFGVVVGDNVEFMGGDASTNFGGFLFPTEFIDIGATNISMAFDLSLGDSGMLTFGNLDFGAGIGNVILTSDNPFVTQANVSFTSNSITLDLSDWFTGGGPATFDLAISEVPLPAAFWLLATAIGGLGFMRRKT